MSDLIKRFAREAETLGRSALERLSSARGADGGAEARARLTIGRPAAELKAFLADPQNLSRVLGREARIVDARPGEAVRWRSPEGAQEAFEGSVAFAPAPPGRGTVASLALRLETGPSASLPGRAGRLAAKPLVVQALYRFKALVETGEIPTLERNPSARPGEGDRI